VEYKGIGIEVIGLGKFLLFRYNGSLEDI